MTPESIQPAREPQPLWRRVLVRNDVRAGLMFVAVATIGLSVSRDYPIGTALRMGTGYMPRLLCWILLALGVVILMIGVRAGDAQHPQPPLAWRPIVLIPGSLIAFALTIERLGLVIAGTVMILLGALAGREFRMVEVAAAAAALVFFTWLIFVYALGLTIPVWPEL